MNQIPRPGFDEAIRALSNVHRRRLLAALLEHNPQEDSVSIPEGVHVGDEELELLQAEMYHNHLPLLEEVGFIEWDRDAHEIVKGPTFDEIRPLIELIDAHADELPDGWV